MTSKGTQLGELSYRLYAVRRTRMRRWILRILARAEGGYARSRTIRRIFRDYHQIEVGMYSYGGCFDASAITPFTRIGRYCSFAGGVKVFNGNHPMEFRSTHPFFFNPEFGFVDHDLAPRTRLVVGNDVWVGCNAIILPAVRHIGDGAVIGAGAVVTKDVPDFAVVAGNPATIIRYRFSEEVQQEIKASRWWDKDVEELTISDFTHALPRVDRSGIQIERDIVQEWM
ncbi:MAG: CatB-related O-acetyltransferase [Sedimentisphaerales bacterium]|nr:CatB-related O-acetyltransferase [Sedimentisphaerales bacterium]